MDAREQRGLVIAATSWLENKNGNWLVPSQSGNGRYIVKPADDGYRCNCPDHVSRGTKCKHIYAVEYTITREQSIFFDTNEQGETTVTQTERVTQTAKITYKQDWQAYNAAQTHEKAHFLSMLHELCADIDEPAQ